MDKPNVVVRTQSCSMTQTPNLPSPCFSSLHSQKIEDKIIVEKERKTFYYLYWKNFINWLNLANSTIYFIMKKSINLK